MTAGEDEDEDDNEKKTDGGGQTIEETIEKTQIQQRLTTTKEAKSKRGRQETTHNKEAKAET